MFLLFRNVVDADVAAVYVPDIFRDILSELDQNHGDMLRI